MTRRKRVSSYSRHEEGPTISAYLQEDHNRLDNLLDMTFLYLKGRSRERAVSSFIEFDEGLRRHIRMEEQILFPIFEEKSGVRSGPTMAMRQEHRRIEGLLSRIREEIEALTDEVASGGPPSRLDELRREMLEALGPHNAKEERILYPACDQVISDRSGVIQKMESIA
jgi:regulator of cell morphogenesis and NO signaling